MKRVRGRAPRPGALFLPRKPDTNKGDYGRLLILAGSKGMSGAAVLCARAALRAGAGLVTVAVPEEIQPVVAVCVPEAMTLALPHAGGVLAASAIGKLDKYLLSEGCDLILAGPGLGKSPGVDSAVKFLLELNMPLVLDADALNSISRAGGFPKPRAARIITPHPGEAARLLKTTIAQVQACRRDSAVSLARCCGGVAVLKGHGTLVAGINGRMHRNESGGPELAKGGSGDVLAGLLSGLWVQRGRQCGFDADTAYESAVAAVFTHGLCGEYAAEAFGGKSVIAGDLLSYFPKAFRTAGREL
ncbi:MAG: NAD(P)H-hydrate dehydratase [Elusimicrobia bacterium]|nr:NAD(P)H-hydrate dehydratase [Elusimicrobiota bacterium]